MSVKENQRVMLTKRLLKELCDDSGRKTVQDMAELMADMIDSVFIWQK